MKLDNSKMHKVDAITSRFGSCEALLNELSTLVARYFATDGSHGLSNAHVSRVCREKIEYIIGIESIKEEQHKVIN